MRKWPVHKARARLGEVLERARTEGPQTITKRGSDHAVVLSMDQYRRLNQRTPRLIEVLLGGPKLEDFEIQPNDDTPRDVDIGD